MIWRETWRFLHHPFIARWFISRKITSMDKRMRTGCIQMGLNGNKGGKTFKQPRNHGDNEHLSQQKHVGSPIFRQSLHIWNGNSTKKRWGYNGDPRKVLVDWTLNWYLSLIYSGSRWLIHFLLVCHEPGKFTILT